MNCQLLKGLWRGRISVKLAKAAQQLTNFSRGQNILSLTQRDRPKGKRMICEARLLSHNFILLPQSKPTQAGSLQRVSLLRLHALATKNFSGVELKIRGTAVSGRDDIDVERRQRSISYDAQGNQAPVNDASG